MPIPFTCPHCGLETDASEEHAGQSGPCSQCGRMVIVPETPTSRALANLKRPPTTRTAVGPIILTVLGVLLLVGIYFVVRSAAYEKQASLHRAMCMNNQKMITLALINYESRHRRFPAYIADKDGKPLLSWRVLILPYLEQHELYAQFHLDEPWDSPHNRPLAAKMPRYFRCPSDRTQASEQTSYVLVTGPGTAFEPGKAIGFDQMRRGASNMVLLSESAESGIVWTEPRDVDIGSLNLGLDAPAGKGVRSGHPDVVIVGYADGHIDSLPKDSSPEELRQSVLVK